MKNINLFLCIMSLAIAGTTFGMNECKKGAEKKSTTERSPAEIERLTTFRPDTPGHRASTTQTIKDLEAQNSRLMANLNKATAQFNARETADGELIKQLHEKLTTIDAAEHAERERMMQENARLKEQVAQLLQENAKLKKQSEALCGTIQKHQGDHYL